MLTHTEEAVLIAIGSKGATLEEIGRDVPKSAAYLRHVVAKLCRLGYLTGLRQGVRYELRTEGIMEVLKCSE